VLLNMERSTLPINFNIDYKREELQRVVYQKCLGTVLCFFFCSLHISYDFVTIRGHHAGRAYQNICIIGDIWSNKLFCIIYAEYINRISSAVGQEIIKHPIMNRALIKAT
jgi:hypothetical protein